MDCPAISNLSTIPGHPSPRSKCSDIDLGGADNRGGATSRAVGSELIFKQVPDAYGGVRENEIRQDYGELADPNLESNFSTIEAADRRLVSARRRLTWEIPTTEGLITGVGTYPLMTPAFVNDVVSGHEHFRNTGSSVYQQDNNAQKMHGAFTPNTDGHKHPTAVSCTPGETQNEQQRGSLAHPSLYQPLTYPDATQSLVQNLRSRPQYLSALSKEDSYFCARSKPESSTVSSCVFPQAPPQDEETNMKGLSVGKETNWYHHWDISSSPNQSTCVRTGPQRTSSGEGYTEETVKLTTPSSGRAPSEITSLGNIHRSNVHDTVTTTTGWSDPHQEAEQGREGRTSPLDSPPTLPLVATSSPRATSTSRRQQPTYCRYLLLPTKRKRSLKEDGPPVCNTANPQTNPAADNASAGHPEAGLTDDTSTTMNHLEDSLLSSDKERSLDSQMCVSNQKHLVKAQSTGGGQRTKSRCTSEPGAKTLSNRRSARTMSAALERLRSLLPPELHPQSRPPSKASTLRLASTYIAILSEMAAKAK